MIRKITLENFMSHGKTVIELADGLTVLTGPNNCGKSALVAALQILATNSKSKHVIRHGAKTSTITVETEEGDTIVWKRKKTTVSYNINGEDVHRIGQGVPEDLPTTLRLDRVTTESGASKNEYDIHFGEQKSPVFLLNETGSRAAAFFASSSDAARLVEMQHLHRTRSTRVRGDAKRLTGESEQNAARLAAFAPIDAISVAVQAAEKMQAEIDTAQQQQRLLAATIGRLRAVANQVSDWRGELTILSALDRSETTPQQLQKNADTCRRMRIWLSTASGVTTARNLEQQRHQTLAALLPLPVRHPAETLAVRIAMMHRTRGQRDVAMRVASTCRDLASPPPLHPAESCRQAVVRLALATQDRATSQRLVDAVAPLFPPPSVDDTGGLVRLRDRLTAAGDTRTRWKSRTAVTSSLSAPPPVQATESLQKKIATLSTVNDHRDRLVQHTDVFERLRTTEPPVDPKPVTAIIARLAPAITAMAAARAKAAQAHELVTQHEQLIRDFVSENPKCVTCGGDINPETLMSTVPSMHEHTHEKPESAPEKNP